ncbi:flagellar filament capping protein FliD [Janthinobacterium sp. Mn2066]|uniref:flagellar filament capping protein FliD n=1 Tax=Janthinobacterium sp. Mn2066 TaxID=3395264 RepID=UPI003BCD33DD
MANVITSPTYDPITTAKNLATNLVAAQKTALTTQATNATNTSAALTSLKSAISAFQSAMSTMTSNKSVLSQAATFSNTAYGSGTAGPKAQPGTYSFFVEALATAAQTSYGGLDKLDAASNTGTLKIQFGGSDTGALNIDLSTVGKNADGTLSLSGIATAINADSNNNSRVTASIITIDGQPQLVLTSNLTGKENAAAFDPSGLADSPLKTALTNNAKPLVAAADAVVWLGGQGTGTKITQASNTFTNVADVKMTFTKAMAAGDAPITVTVATDSTATIANVQTFVDAYNKLKGLMDSLADPGDPTKNVAPGIFAHDSGLNALRSSMNDALRVGVGGVSLVSYGITAQRDGSIALDSKKLTTKLASDPASLDKILGNNNLVNSSGVMGKLNAVLGQWSDITKGQITQRLAASDNLQKTLSKSMDRLNAQYDNAYNRYLDQFTRLQVLQEQMSKTADMFDAMFSNDKS